MINKFFSEQAVKLNLSLRRRVPLHLQTEAAECGLACLAMIAGYHGQYTDFHSLRQRFGFSSRGANLNAIVEIASQMNLGSRPLSLDLDELTALRLPCVLHWGFTHFVVLVSVRKGRYVIHDPAAGRRTVSEGEFSRQFTGIALELWPESTFSKAKKEDRIRLNQLFSSVQGLSRALIKIFFLSLIIESVNLLLPVGTQLVMDHVITASDKGLLGLICTGLLFFVIFRSCVSMVRSWSSLVMSTLIDVQWKSGLFSHLVTLPLDYFARRKLGDIQSRFGSLDVLRSTFTQNIVKAIVDGIMFTGLTVMMFIYSPMLYWFVAAFTLLYVLLRLYAWPRYREVTGQQLIKSARINSHFMETLYGIATVKTQGYGTIREKSWLNLVIDSTNSGIEKNRLDMLFGGLHLFIMTCDQILVLWLGANQVIDQHMTLGMFVAFNAYRAQFGDRVSSLTEALLQLRMLHVHNERIADIALTESDDSREDIDSDASRCSLPLKLKVQDLFYTYDVHTKPVLNGVNFEVAAGESVAIVGASGRGKTTLMKILSGLYSPTSGTIFADDIDINAFGRKKYQKRIGCVLQDDRLFAGSIRDNIVGFTPDYDTEWMEQCARSSFIHDDIMAMPMGYNTLVGELGDGLSGGQKQRLFIARALFRKPGMLLLDEATSHLDQESERAVNDAVQQLNITRIIIAHRPSTIASADRVIHL